MTKLSELKAAETKFKTEVQAKIKANKGGDTWVKVQAIADRVPAALSSPIASIELMHNSKDPKDKLKIPGYFKTLRTQFNAIDLAPVNTYIKEHGEGGSKTRGLLSTAKAKQDEKARVALAGNLIKQFGLMQIMLNNMREQELF